jgi:predicted Ser/Thr protein kinase
MTDGPRDRTEALFAEAVELPPERQRALLEQACAGDPGLRARVERLLADDARLGTGRDTPDFLDSPLVRDLAATTPSAPPAGGPGAVPQLSRYRLLRVLGEGGMGTVYEAEQDSPRRAVALKVIRPGLVAPELLKRFAREAQILGLLHHPGIAAIYEAGVGPDGQPFFAMELVRGVPLDAYARQHGLGDAARLELLARVCDAVQHAHEHGVVHRDLKPSNLLVEEGGQPRVLDFGVARDLDERLRAGTTATQTGQVLGTPQYMSPEQVAADPNLDRRSDVYTLGVILFELLAGGLPYPVEEVPLPEALWRIHTREPARLGAVARRLRGDVETIVGKALEKEPGRRYPSAGELAADIRRHLRHEPIGARPPSALYRLGKFARRHKVLVATTAMFVVLLLVAGAVVAWQAVRAEHAEAVRQVRRSQEANGALARAKVLREEARRSGDRGKWAEARTEARRANALVKGGPVEPGLAERVGDLVRELDEEQADHQLVRRLERAPLLQAEVDVKENLFPLELALPEYRQAFEEYGLRPGETVAAEAAARLRRRPAAVREAVVAALDHWLDLAREENAEDRPPKGRVGERRGSPGRHEKAEEVGWLRLTPMPGGSASARCAGGGTGRRFWTWPATRRRSPPSDRNRCCCCTAAFAPAGCTRTRCSCCSAPSRLTPTTSGSMSTWAGHCKIASRLGSTRRSAS